jgi:hypothetical protein
MIGAGAHEYRSALKISALEQYNYQIEAFT